MPKRVGQASPFPSSGRNGAELLEASSIYNSPAKPEPPGAKPHSCQTTECQRNPAASPHRRQRSPFRYKSSPKPGRRDGHPQGDLRRFAESPFLYQGRITAANEGRHRGFSNRSSARRSATISRSSRKPRAHKDRNARPPWSVAPNSRGLHLARSRYLPGALGLAAVRKRSATLAAWFSLIAYQSCGRRKSSTRHSSVSVADHVHVILTGGSCHWISNPYSRAI